MVRKKNIAAQIIVPESAAVCDDCFITDKRTKNIEEGFKK